MFQKLVSVLTINPVGFLVIIFHRSLLLSSTVLVISMFVSSKKCLLLVVDIYIVLSLLVFVPFSLSDCVAVSVRASVTVSASVNYIINCKVMKT